MTTRRDFLGALGAATLGTHRSLFRLPSPQTHLGNLGVQLYTVRALMQSDFEGTLRQVAAIGYRNVEFAGYFNRTPREVRAILNRHHLAAPSSHIPIEKLENGWDRTLADAHVMGHQYLVVAWTPAERRRTIDDWRRIGDLFTQAGRAAKAAGIKFAYHNHDYEFAPMEGQVPFDILLQSSDPTYVKIEMDLYWIRKGGHDPLAYFHAWPGRFPMVHVKDMTADGRMADVGAGAIDWHAIFAQRVRAGIRYYFVEHDEPADPIASITNSYRYLSRLSV